MNVPVEPSMMTSSSMRFLDSSTAFFAIAFLLLPVFMPLASATGMSSCGSGTCDTYSDSHDMTPNNQDWVEGQYSFQMVDTSTIDLELTWALREFNRSSVGLDDGPTNTLLANDGLGDEDGIPADMLRNYIDEDIGGPGTPTIGERLMSEVNTTVQDLLTEGFGSVSSLQTQYTAQITQAGQSTACTQNPNLDAADEGAAVNNAFEPPICFSTTARVVLDMATFNLAGSPDMDLERTYQGLLVMGADITTNFQIFAQAGHRSTFQIEPPNFADVTAVDDNGTRVAITGDVSHFGGEWTLDNRAAADGGEETRSTTSLTIAHLNTSTTNTVTIPENQTSIFIDLNLDMTNEERTTLDIIAGLNYLETSTLESWGVSLVQTSNLATFPHVTADGVRLAHEGGIANLSLITDQFPVSDIVNSITDSIDEIGSIGMSPLTWVNDSVADGISGPAGGLEYSHTQGCTETAPPGQSLHYCVEGAAAMGYDHPVYLRSTSQEFDLSLLDLVSSRIDDSTAESFLNEIRTDDLRKIFDSGLMINAELNTSMLDDLLPDSLPNAEMRVSITLPSWVRNSDGTRTITIDVTGDGPSPVGLQGQNPFDWRHQIDDEDGNPICLNTHKTCVSTNLLLDVTKYNINEWRRQMQLEFALDAELSIHRVMVPEGGELDFSSGNVTMPVIPSDLLRLALDLTSRMDEPIMLLEDEPICPESDFAEIELSICDETISFELSRDGLNDFADDMSDILTTLIRDGMESLQGEQEMPNGDSITIFSEIDMSAFSIEFSLEGIDAPDQNIGDDEALTMRVSIPKVKFTFGTALGLGDINQAVSEFNANPEDPPILDPQLYILTDAMTAPIAQAMSVYTSLISRSVTAGYTSNGGFVYPPTEEPAISSDFQEVDTTVADEVDFSISGPVSIILPKGMELQELSSDQDRITTETVDGRQKITYLVPPGQFDDSINYRIHIGFDYLWSQFWYYPIIPTIMLSLLVLRWRRRRKRRKERRRQKRAERMNAKADNKSGKLMSDSEFDNLLGVNSPNMGVGLYEDGMLPDYMDQENKFN